MKFDIEKLLWTNLGLELNSRGFQGRHSYHKVPYHLNWTRLAWNEASPVPHEAARWLPEAADLLQIICGRLLRAAVRAGDQRSDQQHVSDDQQLLKQPSLVDSPPP